jgi:hypothetical protein
VSLHIYRAENQPLTRYRDTVLLGMGYRRCWFRHHPRDQMRCHVCGRRRWAKNLRIQVYYDSSVISCRGECWPGQKSGMRRPKDWPE